MGSSPHTRGAPDALEDAGLDRGIIPAYAGSTRRKPERRSRSRDHPRIRGEHTSFIAAMRRAGGSSPHTRGALTVAAIAPEAAGIIPAYAGSTRWPPSGIPYLRDHPRIRGEHVSRSSGYALAAGSSPHTRGALPTIRRPCVFSGIIPAYAGSTDCKFAPYWCYGDHPRIRGEHCAVGN